MSKEVAMAILAEYNTDMIRGKLLEFPGLIREAKRKVRDATDYFKGLEMTRKEIEADMVVDIAAEVNPQTGKPVYSNEAARAAALNQKKATDEEYSQVYVTARAAERNITEAQDDLDRLFDEYKSYRYVARLVANELALLSEDELDCGGSVPVRAETAAARDPY